MNLDQTEGLSGRVMVPCYLMYYILFGADDRM